MSAPRALVTGCAGFLGSHLCDRLLAEGYTVIALDDLSTGSADNVAHLADNPRFELVRHDVREPYEFGVSRIYNLACAASPVHYQRDPIKTMLTNVVGTFHGLELARRSGARFFQASTSEIYGDPREHPQRESYRGNVSSIGPRACYDEGKRSAETLCMDYRRKHGVEVRIARIFNTYGPRMSVDDGRVVSNFITQALRREPLTVYGDGHHTRSLCFVDDLVDGIIRLSNHPTETGPVNLGNDVEVTIADLATRVRELTGTTSTTAYLPLPMDDPQQRWPDLTLARTVLGYEPHVGLRDGLERTISYFRSRTDTALVGLAQDR